MKIELVNAFKPKFQLKSIILNQNPACDVDLDPPIAAKNPYTLAYSECGGFDHYFPKSLFNDAQDGDASNLRLELHDSAGSLVSSTFPWMTYDMEKQRLYGYPNRFDAIDYNFL